MTENPIRVLAIFGTRPEATKMAPLIKEMQRRAQFEPLVCVTAQHRHMLDQALTLFDITPDYDLDIMRHGQSVADITRAVLWGMERVLQDTAPDMVLVHGDTTTTFAAALSAFYAQVPLGHVEAGLRTYDKTQPYPEEMNRRLTAALADIHFAPTETSKANLMRENIDPARVIVTGNTALDCLKLTVRDDYRFKYTPLNDIHKAAPPARIIAITAHRRENWGQPLADICNAVLALVNRHADIEAVYAVHQNPRVHNHVHALLGGHPRIRLTPPLDMDDMHNLISRSYMVMTDSGGLQEEAPGLDKPVLVLRSVTERPEGLDAGVLMLCGTAPERIIQAAERLLSDAALYERMSRAPNPFGDGYASGRIADGILRYFKRSCGDV